VIAKLLVANRAEIARRIFRTARAMGIGTVAVYSDADAGAPHADEADEAVRLPGSAPADTYLRADLLVEAALRTGADAVHPGYGFLAENAAFARACIDAGLTFVGPPPDAIEAMGSKLAAKALMIEAGVPVLEGIDVSALKGKKLAAAAEGVGFPVLVKASFGGGGRGMRIVRDSAELADAVDGARREAEAAFGDGAVFLERYVEAPRHVEIQVFGDQHGHVVHLFERECSIQRRHQKIVEEAPSPAVDAALRARMGEAACAAARSVGYTGAGTVEFLLDGGDYWFLEMNTRLQVEHPVTELVTGVDLVRAQLEVAAGEPLPGELCDATLRGHAIEVRLYAEDAASGFRPSTGRITRFHVPSGDGVRVDSGVETGTVVSPHYDPMLAKVIAWGSSRDEAVGRLGRALTDARISGVVTNRDLLVAVLRHTDFEAGRTDTAFLSRNEPEALVSMRRSDAAVRLHAAAAALALQAANRASAPVLRSAPSGWRNNPSSPQRVAFATGVGHAVEVEYRVGATGDDGTARAEVSVDGVPLGADVAVTVDADEGGAAVVHLEVDGIRRRVDLFRTGAVIDADSALGSTPLEIQPRFPDASAGTAAGSQTAPMPGVVRRVAVVAGDKVEAGAALVVIEAMKMEHTIAAPAAGVVQSVRVAVGDQLDAGQVLVVIDAVDGDAGA
jgi:acetyl-CoA carboxylase biotin carboxylase subunit